MSVKIQEMHLRDYLKVLKKRRNIAILFGLVTFSLIAIYTITATPLYEGKTKILIERADANINVGGRSLSNNPEFYQTQLQVIRSRAVAERVSDLLNLSEEDIEQLGLDPGLHLGRRLKSIASPLLSIFGEAKEREGTSPQDKIVKAITEGIQVQPVPETHIVNISFLSPNPQFSALVANTTAKAFIEENLDMKMEATRSTLDWMNKKAEQERQNLENAERALHAYMKDNNIVTLENRVTGTPEELSELSTELVRAESRRKQLEALNNKIQEVLRGNKAPETISAIASDPALQSLRAQIVAAEKNIMELSGKYGSRHPVMEKAQRDLEVLKSKKDQEIQRIVDSIRNEYELALANERNLRGQLNQSRSETLNLNEKFVQYGVLQREVETNRQIYDALMMRIKEQSVTDETSPVNTWIVENAKVPEVPARPMIALNLLIGFFLALGGGVGLAFFAEYLDNTVKDPREAEETLQLPVMGVISKGKDQEMEEVVTKDPLSPYAENYKGLRTALMLSSPSGEPPSKVLITSSVSGEGKTTTAVNLALALAQSEKQVVILDADLRKPRLHKIFKLHNRIGLSSYLAGASDQDILKRGPLPNLAVVTSGPIPPNPSELIMSKRVGQLIDLLSERFDYIICDSPPVLPVNDSRALSRLFDGTILIVQAHKTTYDMAAQAIKGLREIQTPVLGMVMNGLDMQKSDYNYAYYETYQEQVAPGK